MFENRDKMSFAKVGKPAFVVIIFLMLASPFALSGDDAILLRYAMDILGNNDTQVSSSEVTDFEITYEAYVQEFGNEYTMNAIEGTFTGLTTTFKNAEGPVLSDSAITYEYTGRIYFPGLDDELEAYSFRIVNEGGDVNSTMTIQITVPKGYEITFIEGILAPITSESGRTVNGPTLTDANINIGFRPVDEFSQYYTPILISGVICAVVIGAIALSRYRSDVDTEDEVGEPDISEPQDVVTESDTPEKEPK